MREPAENFLVVLLWRKLGMGEKRLCFFIFGTEISPMLDSFPIQWLLWTIFALINHLDLNGDRLIKISLRGELLCKY